MLDKKILITGGAGFIGYHLINYLLKEDYLIKIIDKFPINYQNNNLKSFKKYKNFSYSKINLKFRIKKKFNNLSHVFHLAASLGVKNINKDPYDSFKNNINSLINLIDNLKNYSPNSILIYFSSSEVYSPLISRKKIKLPAKEDIDLLVSKDIIKRGGEVIAPIEIEEVIRSLSTVEDVAVIGIPDIVWGEKILAVVVPKKNCCISDKEIIEYCHDHLSSFKKPEKVILVNNLPTNHLGKVLKNTLRDKFSQNKI